jgi:PBP1b-binding outer membrane lipoprotein LpoB
MKTFFRAQLQIDRLILIIVLALLLAGCRVTLLPDYDDSIAQEILETAKRVDKFYLDMLETTVNENGDRAYNKMVDSYVEIEVELSSLLSKNKIRPLNENSIRICEITLELWVKYKEEHKEDNELSDGLIKLNRLTFSDLFYAMLVAEKAKEIISNLPK